MNVIFDISSDLSRYICESEILNNRITFPASTVKLPFDPLSIKQINEPNVGFPILDYQTVLLILVGVHNLVHRSSFELSSM